MGRAKKRAYDRIGTYSIEDVLAHVVFDVDVNAFVKLNGISNVHKDQQYWDFIEREFDGHKVKMNSHRYQNFKTHGTDCVECGLKGEFFALERSGGITRYHFNLYGYNEDGFEVMLTKDHIIPKSKGGKNNLNNYQPMCARCNARKGNGDAKKKATNVQASACN